MEDLVAVKVRSADRQMHYFVTWGRIFDPVDPRQIEAVIASHAHNFGIKRPSSTSMCDRLSEASNARYFYEALFDFCQKTIPRGKIAYSKWRKKTKMQMLSGKHLYYCGSDVKNTDC
jgi:hypothetical protein